MCYIISALNSSYYNLPYDLPYISSTYEQFKRNNKNSIILSVKYSKNSIQELQNIHLNSKISDECIELINYLDLNYLLWNYEVNLDNSLNLTIQILNNIIKNIKFYINEYFKHEAIQELLLLFHNNNVLNNIDNYITIEDAVINGYIDVINWYNNKKQVIIKNGLVNIDWSSGSFLNKTKNNLIYCAIKKGNIKTLDWIYNYCNQNNICFNYDIECIKIVARFGHIEMLKWFQNYCYETNLQFINSCDSMYNIIKIASCFGRTEVLDWCLQYCNKYNIDFCYDEKTFIFINDKCCILALNWFINYSKQYKRLFNFLSYTISNCAHYGWIDVIEWINNYYLSINTKISQEEVFNIINNASYSNKINILEWIYNYTITHNLIFDYN